MIVIYRDLGLDCEPPRAYRNFVDRRNRLGYYVERYVTGYDAPNYPVPAIPAHCEFFPDRVILWHGMAHVYENDSEVVYMSEMTYLACLD